MVGGSLKRSGLVMIMDVANQQWGCRVSRVGDGSKVRCTVGGARFLSHSWTIFLVVIAVAGLNNNTGGS